ncbi:uncharacterized protein LOC122856339 [Aphidius gifuensis]|uniref:uncharacterized protein LOC122856339 n=1 Tax=Aphidius gifuensis TaxID=684658 RepID=UPI001CDBA16C|nr:uncharacterized protein LOC122856339 [Aphidius gifuensis]
MESTSNLLLSHSVALYKSETKNLRVGSWEDYRIHILILGDIHGKKWVHEIYKYPELLSELKNLKCTVIARRYWVSGFFKDFPKKDRELHDFIRYKLLGNPTDIRYIEEYPELEVQFKKIIQRVNDKRAQTSEKSSTQCEEDLLKDFEKADEDDMMFLDIEMPVDEIVINNEIPVNEPERENVPLEKNDMVDTGREYETAAAMFADAQLEIKKNEPIDEELVKFFADLVQSALEENGQKKQKERSKDDNTEKQGTVLPIRSGKHGKK